MVNRRRRLTLGEVICPHVREVEVRRENRGPDAVPCHRSSSDVIEELVRDDRCRDECQHGGGKDPFRATPVELQERDPSGVPSRAEQEIGDQKACQDEENIDPTLTTRYLSTASMSSPPQPHGHT